MAENHIKIRYGDSETGWAENLGCGLARICNIPLTDNLNIDDVVRLEPGSDGFQKVAKVVTPGFPKKTAINYETVQQYQSLAKRVRDAGNKIEGMFAPGERDGKPLGGLALVAHDDTFDPIAIAKEVGIANPEMIIPEEDDDEEDDDDDGTDIIG